MKNVAIIGGGPGGLMAAEIIAGAGHAVTVYERKPTVGRKFMQAGIGGLNLTHSEDFETFMTRYGSAATHLRPALENFTPQDLRAWCEGLGEPTFTGSSGRVFPKSFKASSLLRKWRTRLDGLGVKFVHRAEWQGWNDKGELLVDGAAIKADAVLFALGGASWPKLGSDGGWVGIFEKQGVKITPLKPANCGFETVWSDIFRQKFARQPVKPVAMSFNGITQQGEIMITENGIEGGLVYAFSGPLRDAISREGRATFTLDLKPGVAKKDLSSRIGRAGSASFANILRKNAGLSPTVAALARECGGQQAPDLAHFIKNLPLTVTAPFPIARAISTAGGVAWDAVDAGYMLKQKPGTFVAGEMLDWEAPTGGYLLQATFSTAVMAAQNLIKHLQ